ncbi:MAG: N-acetylmuramoyl-L-alanine amidase, partial [Bacteroidota bacterium]|nr:N-acetylmuramoyl-L-alanine amidase [Bacteroidota bacterium]
MVSYISRTHFELNTYRILIASLLLLMACTAFAQDYKTITAKKGDGIYSVLKQNGLSPGEYLNQFIELNKTKLGKDNALIIGRTYRLPVVAEKDTIIRNSAPVSEAPQEKIIYEIFGDKYKEVTIRSRELSKAVYYLMSGHGGPDPGAIGSLNGHLLCEDEYAYDVTLRLARSLIERGATVYMIIRDPNDGIRDDQFLTPDRDEVCFPNDPIPLNQLARLRQSTEAVNKLYIQNKGKFQRLVVIHIDSRSQKENI